MIRCGVAIAAAAFALTSFAKAETSEAMAFAIGMCSAQSDAQARLKCYDDLAAKLKAGQAIGPQASGSPAPVYTPPPAPTPAPPISPPVAAVPTPPPAAAPPATTFGTAVPSKNESAWYNPGSWFGGSSDNAQPRATTGTPGEFGAETIPQQEKPGEPPRPEPLDQISAKVTNVAFNSNGHFTVTLDNGQTWRQLEGDTGQPRFNKRGGDTVTISRGLLGSYNLVVEGHNAMFKVKRIQ